MPLRKERSRKHCGSRSSWNGGDKPQLSPYQVSGTSLWQFSDHSYYVSQLTFLLLHGEPRKGSSNLLLLWAPVPPVAVKVKSSLYLSTSLQYQKISHTSVQHSRWGTLSSPATENQSSSVHAGLDGDCGSLGGLFWFLYTGTQTPAGTHICTPSELKLD